MSTSVTVTPESGPQTSAGVCPCCVVAGGCCRSGSGAGTCCYSPGTIGILAISIVLPECNPQPPKFRFPNDDAIVAGSGVGSDCGSPANLTMHRGDCLMTGGVCGGGSDAGDCQWTYCFGWTDASVADGTVGTARGGCISVAVRDNAGVKEWKLKFYADPGGGFVENYESAWTAGSCIHFNLTETMSGFVCFKDPDDHDDTDLPATICFDFSIVTETNHCHYDPDLDDCIEELI